jgi:PAS domain S-box-containing protein
MPKSLVGVPVSRKKDGGTIVTLTLQDVDGEKTFTESDVRLLETLANSMSVALENARLFDESQRLLNETEQRAAELQIINSVQEGLASKLEMQAIYDLVGEKIREIFNADTTFIAFHDVEKDLIAAPFYTDQGEKLLKSGRPYGKGLAENIIESGETLLYNTSDEMNAAGAYNISSPGSDQDLNQSFLGAPIFRSGKPIGATSVQSYQQYAFDQNDLSLLQTLTNSMSVALENARLFDETQLLLEETELRAAELATINAVGQALVAESELETLIEMIGEKMRETFAADIVYIALLNHDANLIHFPYTYGEEFDPLKFGEGLTSKIIQSGESLLINREMDKRRAEMGVTQVGVKARSYLGVPIQYGGQTFGVISVQSTSEEGRFDQSDQHLLNTIAANVGSALRNAQLFDQVKRQKQYYEAVIENSPAAIVLLDMETNVTGWNPAAERLFGYTEAEALNRNIDDLVAFSEELHAEAVRYSEKALEEKSVHLLTRRTRKDGSLVEVEVSGLPVSVDGEYVGFIAIYHDVTELQHARQEAEEANRAKSTFLANMSHELRTPLNAIIGFSRIVRRKGGDVLPRTQVENLDKVLVSADHLLNLINTVLDISKIEAGRMDVKPTTFELPPLVDLVIDTSQPFLREGVSIKTDLKPAIPEVFSDQDKLKQILLNLISNAAKFTHEGEITLASRHDGERLYIDVNDTGIGVSEDALARIFEDFQQADTSTTREYGGTGLGLPISRSLARLLGGDLTACSIEGEGSTFTLSMPVHYSGKLEEGNTDLAVAQG